MTRISLFSVPLVLLLSGCEFLTDPGERVMGIIGSIPAGEVFELRVSAQGPSECDGRDLPHPRCSLVAPDSVDSGVPFDVVVRTGGTLGCWKADGAEVSLSGLAVEVVPYDRVVSPLCADAPTILSRTLSLTFEEPGDALIRVTGRVVILGDGTEEELIGSHEHVLVVR